MEKAENRSGGWKRRRCLGARGLGQSCPRWLQVGPAARGQATAPPGRGVPGLAPRDAPGETRGLARRKQSRGRDRAGRKLQARQSRGPGGSRAPDRTEGPPGCSGRMAGRRAELATQPLVVSRVTPPATVPRRKGKGTGRQTRGFSAAATHTRPWSPARGHTPPVQPPGQADTGSIVPPGHRPQSTGSGSAAGSYLLETERGWRKSCWIPLFRSRHQGVIKRLGSTSPLRCSSKIAHHVVSARVPSLIPLRLLAKLASTCRGAPRAARETGGGSERAGSGLKLVPCLRWHFAFSRAIAEGDCQGFHASVSSKGLNQGTLRHPKNDQPVDSLGPVLFSMKR